ncbi:GNAT family N-acetyltransferase [Capnocytophaga stomatis]|uniref:GNAT family N-acetyltransferase n=1 Tax=Capnocytophaga stomatis TaxID=1848904 RepID=A0ABW8QAM0_9FLAO|nr:GNAT family N-acetyltransferase [Capnocytophaga stomatis]GIJ93636.1 N-acetyltransferase [Capnocytophaga stomatis]
MKNVVNIRPMNPSEYPLLEDFLYEAIFLPEGVAPPSRDIILLPELQLYIAEFGTQKVDIAFVAEVEKKIVGAAWSRIVNDYGHIDDRTPSLSISLYSEYRNQGIGTKLFQKLLDQLAEEGYEKASLSVQKANYAAKMYLKMGFYVVKENEEDYVMVIDLNSTNTH